MTTPKEVHSETIRRNLPTIIGKNLYALRTSELFEPSTAPEDLVQHKEAQISEFDKRSTEYLAPLRILKADYNEDSDSVLFKLAMADGRTALAVGSYIEEGPSAPFLQRIENTLFAAIPSRFSAID